MSGGPNRSLLLVPTSEPDPGLPRPAVALYWGWGRVGVLSPPWYAGPAEPLPDSSEPLDWQIPPAMAACVEMVVEHARRHHSTVKLVDINRPGEDRDRLRELSLEDCAFPILVRPDGRVLEGIESFDESRVEQFLTEA